jgi:hypothetical protein
MQHNGATSATVKADKLIRKSPKVKPLSYNEILHLYVDRGFNHRRLARRLRERGLNVSPAYISCLMRRKRLGKRPYGRLLLQAIADELRIDVRQLKPEPEGGDQP